MSGEMSADKPDGTPRHVAAGSEWQGRKVSSADAPELHEALLAACDYRGDVTLALVSGDSMSGYVFHCDVTGTEPHVDLLPASGKGRTRVRIADIETLGFSGDDKAAGKSWQAWVSRFEEKKRLAAEGIDLGNIEPEIEPLG